MFWLEKLVSFRLESDDVLKEFARAELLAERLSSVITKSNPLLIDEILSMVVTAALPDSFKPTFTPLLQMPTIFASNFLSTITEEVTRMELAGPRPFAGRAALTKGPRHRTQLNLTSEAPSYRLSDLSSGLFCRFCKRLGHTSTRCHRLSRRKGELGSKLNDLKEKLARLESSLTNSSAPRSGTSASRDKASVLLTDTPMLSSSTTGPSFSVNQAASSESSGTDYSYTSLPIAPPSGAGRFLLNLGCTAHMVPEPALVSNFSLTHLTIYMANGFAVPASQRGFHKLGGSLPGDQTALVVPSLKEWLLSVSQLVSSGLSLVFETSGCKIYSSADIRSDVIGFAPRVGGLYYMYLPASEILSESSISSINGCDLADCHRRLSQPSLKALRSALWLEGIEVSTGDFLDKGCQVFLKGKMRRRNLHSRVGFKATTCFSVIHSNVAEFDTEAFYGCCYFVSFIEDFSNFVRVF